MEPMIWRQAEQALAGLLAARFTKDIIRKAEERMRADVHGTLPSWISAWQRLPHTGSLDLEATRQTSAVVVSNAEPIDLEPLTRLLMEFHPWRKGPFEIFGTRIDTEWRSDWKWNRMAKKLEFRGKKILDVGCGNGYYGWKMLAEGADFVLGCDPFLLYVMQFEVFRKYAPQPHRHFVLPLGDTDLPDRMQCFDLCLSMGVLYHRSGPIDHLQKMHGTLKPGGQLLLETLVIESDQPAVLVPKGRYAKMRNVWFIPSVAMLEIWLERTGFEDIRILDVSTTTEEEQRRTPWMTFESLADFLDPQDPRKTVEGYPAPRRAMLLAVARK